MIVNEKERENDDVSQDAGVEAAAVAWVAAVGADVLENAVARHRAATTGAPSWATRSWAPGSTGAR